MYFMHMFGIFFDCILYNMIILVIIITEINKLLKYKEITLHV